MASGNSASLVRGLEAVSVKDGSPLLAYGRQGPRRRADRGDRRVPDRDRRPYHRPGPYSFSGIPLSAIVYVDPWSSGECRTKGLFCPISAWTKLVRTGKIWHPTRAAHAAVRPAKLPFSRTRKLGRGGFKTLRASRVRWRQVAPARQDRNAGETDGQKKYRVCEAVPRR